jgi:uncharacterized membrane protein HdeD (DUF308 family)
LTIKGAGSLDARACFKSHFQPVKGKQMKHWIFWLIDGVVSLLGGFTALANPLAASLTAELLAG